MRGCFSLLGEWAARGKAKKELLLRGYGMHGWNEKGKMFSFYARGQKLFSPSVKGGCRNGCFENSRVCTRMNEIVIHSLTSWKIHVFSYFSQARQPASQGCDPAADPEDQPSDLEGNHWRGGIHWRCPQGGTHLQVRHDLHFSFYWRRLVQFCGTSRDLLPKCSICYNRTVEKGTAKVIMSWL